MPKKKLDARTEMLRASIVKQVLRGFVPKSLARTETLRASIETKNSEASCLNHKFHNFEHG